MTQVPIISTVNVSSLEIRLSRTENLPSISPAAIKALHEIDRGDPNVEELEGVLQSDPAIAAKLLRVVNSAAYGLSGITHVGRAIQVLGFTTLKRIVLSVAFQQAIYEEQGEIAIDRFSLWQHSYAVAVGARAIASMRGIGNPDELFTAGLLHDLGILCVEKFMYAHCRAAFILSKRDQLPLQDAEVRVLGWNHATAAGIIARKWGLPRVVERAMEFHHAPSLDEECFSTTCVVAVANDLANQAGLVHTLNGVLNEPDICASMEIELTPDEVADLQHVMVEEVLRAQAAFGLGPTSASASA